MSTHVSESQVYKLLNRWQSRLGLDDWRIALVFEDTAMVDDHPCQMTVQRSQYYKRATIKISRSALNVNTLPECIEKDLLTQQIISLARYIEEGIVHELLHVVLRGLMEASDLIREDLHPTTRMTWDGAFKRAEEATVDSLAKSLVTNWPA